MGVETRKKPPLPAPTDSSFNQTSGDDPASTELDLATDLSRRTDRTSYSIPEDGSPVTIDTTKKRDKGGKGILHSRNKSQTSLLIEYFEAGKGPNVSSKPSVRVKVTPSSAKKGKENQGQIHITEGTSTRKPSYTRRISLGHRGESSEQVVEQENQSVTTGSTVSGLRAPIDIEVIGKEGSDLSGTSVSNRNEEYTTINPSEISSMPPDSMLETAHDSLTPKRTRSRSVTRETADTLKAPSRRRSRSLSRERLTQKVIEKLGQEPRKVSGGKEKRSSRSRSVSKEHPESMSSPKHRSSRHRKYEDIPSAEPSLLSASQVSDGRSFKSGTSKSSINNPKLLETVEDAIRRLILPELTALKHEQKTQKTREKFEKGSTTSSAVSKDDPSRKLSKHASDPNVRGSKPKVVLNRDEHDPGLTLSGDSIKKKKKTRNSGDGLNESLSERSFERGMSEETVVRDDGKSPRRRSKDGHRTRDAVAAGLIGGVLTREALKHHDSNPSIEKRERRKKRSKSHSRSHSRSASITESEDIFHKHDVPPMPMRSEITNSDVTRDSILSERTSTPTSEKESRRAEIRQVARGSPRQINSPTSSTPTRSPRSKGLDSYYRNDARDDLGYTSEGSPLAREHNYSDAAFAGAAGAAGAGAGYLAGRAGAERFGSNEDNSYTQGRGLSPIQSVASFEERGEDPPHDSMHSVDTVSYSSEAEVLDHSGRPKGFSLESDKEILGAHHLRSNQSLSQDHNTNSWYEHEKPDQYRNSIGEDSYGDSKIDVRHLTNYTDDSMDAPYLDKVTAAQEIRGLGNNAEFIHTPIAVESAVASLHGSSIVDGKSIASGGSRLGEQKYTDSPSAERHVEEDEYAYDERPLSKGGKGSPLKNQFSPPGQDIYTLSGYGHDEESPSKSPRQSAARSLDEYLDEPVMTASGVPLVDDPMPEIGHGIESQKSDISTNPSIIRGPMGGSLPDNKWGYSSPSPVKEDPSHDGLKAAARHVLSAAQGAGAGAAIAQQARKSMEDQSVSRDIGMDQSYHKQPEDYIPVDDIYPTAGKDYRASPIHKDEGYISENPNAGSRALTPDHRHKGGLYSNDVLDDIIGKPSAKPFTPGHTRNFSGNSHGMASPLYDSATGRGVDRIQSKDIVALMDHVSTLEALKRQSLMDLAHRT